MPVTFSTPSGSPTKNFSTNTNSPVVGFNTTTQNPQSGSGPNDFPSAIVAYSGQVRFQTS